MCRMIDRLAREASVERHPDPDDRRATRVRLTPRGPERWPSGARAVDRRDRGAHLRGAGRGRARSARRAPAARDGPAARLGAGALVSRARNADAAKSLRLTLAGLVTAAMAFALMQTFLIPALPRLQEDLHTSGTWVTWTVTAYLLTGSVATPIIGRLGDQHGKVKLMLIALVDLPGRVDRGDLRVEHLVADRVARGPGRGRRGLPAQLRDHPRRVPEGEGERRDGPGVGRPRGGRRRGDRGQRPDHRQPLVAVPVRGERGRRGRRPRPGVALRARLARSPRPPRWT